ncbi:MAG: hypothetical protein Q9184_001893 [Pyrenodesmia sp. 2 TL-2023]
MPRRETQPRSDISTPRSSKCIAFKADGRELCGRNKLSAQKNYKGTVDGPNILKELCPWHGTTYREDPTQLKLACIAPKDLDVVESSKPTPKPRGAPVVVKEPECRPSPSFSHGHGAYEDLTVDEELPEAGIDNPQQMPVQSRNVHQPTIAHRSSLPAPPNMHTKFPAWYEASAVPEREREREQQQRHSPADHPVGDQNLLIDILDNDQTLPGTFAKSTQGLNSVASLQEQRYELIRSSLRTLTEAWGTSNASHNSANERIQALFEVVSQIDTRVVKQSRKTYYAWKKQEEDNSSLVSCVKDLSGRLQRLEHVEEERKQRRVRVERQKRLLDTDMEKFVERYDDLLDLGSAN